MKRRLIAVIAAAALAAGAMPSATAANGAAEPVLRYTFDNKNPLADENGKNELKLSGGASVTDNGNTGKALTLDGVDGYALLPEGILTDSFTVASWVKIDRFTAWGRVFDFGTDANNNFFFAPYSGSTARLEMKSPTGTDTVDTVQETERDWVHYAVTYENGTLNYYRNGLLVDTKSNMTVKPTDIKDTLNYIGKSHYDGDAYLAAAVDDFRVYDKALTADEISGVFAEGEIDPAVLLGSYTIENGALITGSTLTLPQTEGLIWSETDDLGLIDTQTGAVTHPENTAKVTLAAEYGGEKAEYTVYVAGTARSPYTVNIDASDRSKDVSDIMWGLFFEDINSSADGGLYAEMVQNRSFEIAADDNLYSWETLGDAKISTENPMNENNPTYITLGKGASITNDGYMGMSVKKDAVYNFSARVRGNADLMVSIGGASAEVKADGSDWQEVTAALTAAENASDAKLIVKNTGKTVDIDIISLIPEDTYKGHGLRKDLMETLEAMHPKFLRFPGGCAVEGNTMDVAWNWKDTVGDVSERREMVNIWSPADGTYQMTYGLGFYEYFQMCEDLGMEPVPILNCGLSCQVRSGGNEDENHVVPMDELQPYIDDALDLIAFANGTDESNEWVKLRKEMGHSEPFNLKYIGIGNEQYGDIYFERYAEFAKQIHEKYPDINLVTTSGTASSGSNNDLAWNWINANTEFADRVDEHYYESADWFKQHAYRYDDYRRDTNSKVFLGEYASKGNTWYNALCEAAFMTGLERNADVVRMASYAPMFAKYGNTQWTAANMIWFTNDDYVLTPNYYVQSLFSNNHGDYTLPTDVEMSGIPAEDYLHGGVVLGSWGTQNEFKDAHIQQNIPIEGGSGDIDVAPDGWQTGIGEWTIGDDGVITQTSDSTGATVYNDWAAANPSMADRDYTFTVKAKKNGGGEGFQIGVAAEDGMNYYRVNVGGWGNTTAKIQHIVNGVSADVGNAAEQSYIGDVHINDGEWYDVKVEVSDYEIQAYLNGEFICSYTKPKEYGPVYASSTYDSEAGEIIAKIVNTTNSDTTVEVNIDTPRGMGFDTSAKAKTITMTADTGAVNTLENKDNIVPAEGEFEGIGGSFDYPVKANSLSIIRIPTMSVNAVSPPGYQHQAYMSGYGDGTYRPDSSVTRAEAAALIARITDGFDDTHTYRINHEFTDVADGAWYKNYVNYLSDKNYVSGYSDGTYRPDNSVTRAELAKIICSYLGEAPAENTQYTDIQGHWAEGYIAALSAKGIITGYDDGTFRPNAPVSRAEMITLINRALGRFIENTDWFPNEFTDVPKSHWAYKEFVEAVIPHNTKQCQGQ